ncbi:hypothetical protein PC123_g25721 [Phytophthora cactorum]|nr:hypothetical protein PC123_g25721 [Phytophthora cactorum]
MKYNHRYESGYKTKVNRWLQTFSEFVEEGEFDDFAVNEDDDSSQHAECDVESERCGSSMEDVKSVVGSLAEEPHDVWRDRLRSRITPSNDEANHPGNADSEPGDSPGEPDDNRSDYSKQSEFEHEGELDNEYAESVVHVTELTTVMNAADYNSRDADSDFLFDPEDEREGAGGSDGGGVLVPVVREQADELIP